MNPRKKLTPCERRALTLRALYPGSNISALAREYDVSRAYVHRLVKEATTRALEQYREARAEYNFRKEVFLRCKEES